MSFSFDEQVNVPQPKGSPPRRRPGPSRSAGRYWAPAYAGEALTIEWKATNCGFVRGSVSGTANAYAVAFAADADACFVEDADLTGISNSTGNVISLVTTHPFRLTNNGGSAQRSPLGLGPQLTITLTGTSLSANSSFVALTAGGYNLQKILSTQTTPPGQFQAGDLIVLSAASGMVTVEDGTGNLQLATASGSIVLGGSSQDTLTLLCRGPDWVQVAYSKNN